ncbi:MAG: hypothetical protein HN759_05320 [Akkermansiaceae bacterium]|jgi:hypothetical protein|nr:hypothetical protein [Akkermansiaceae bacterium]
MHSNLPSGENFATISAFLSTFAPEVSGRSSDEVTPFLKQKLQSLAAGELNEEEARNISQDLLANENAMQTLAGLIIKHP